MFSIQEQFFQFNNNVLNSRTMFSIQEQCSQFKNNVLNSRTMFSIQEQCFQFKNNVLSSRTMFLDTSLCVQFLFNLRNSFYCCTTFVDSKKCILLLNSFSFSFEMYFSVITFWSVLYFIMVKCLYVNFYKAVDLHLKSW